MRILYFSRISFQILSFIIIIYALNFVFTSFFAFAEEKISGADSSRKSKKIHIAANKLVTDKDARFLEFIGDVNASQENLSITSDKLRIYYKEGAFNNKEKSKSDEGSIKKIIAIGNVIITFDDKVAMSDQADFFTEKRILVLTGDNSKLTSGNNSITGSRITLYQNDGRITVESNGENRVKAIFYSEEKGFE